MKIKSGFAKREIAGTYIVVPVGSKIKDFNGMITLNETGAFIWDCLSEDITLDELTDKIVAEYDIDSATATADATRLLAKLAENNLIEE